MKKHLFFLIFFSISISYSTASESDDVKRSVEELDKYIENKEYYVQLRESRIRLLMEKRGFASKDAEKLNVYNSLFDEYKSYKYDSAFVYAKKTLDIANR